MIIAIAIACKPPILIADEPTTALDVTIQAQILDLLKDLQEETGSGIILITHDLGVVAEMADRVAVMYAGQFVEVATAEELFSHPKHPRSLLQSIPQENSDEEELHVIEGIVPSLTKLPRKGCRFAHEFLGLMHRNMKKIQHYMKLHRIIMFVVHVINIFILETGKGSVMTEIIQIKDLKVHYPIRSGFFNRITDHVLAVDGVDFMIEQGKTYGLVGESGSGKSTTGKAIIGLEKLQMVKLFIKDKM